MSVEDLNAARRKRRDESPEPAPWARDLVRCKSGEARTSFGNACIAIREPPDLRGKLAFDEFAGCTYIRGPLPWDDRANRTWAPQDDLAVTEWLHRLEKPDAVGVSSSTAAEAVEPSPMRTDFTRFWNGSRASNGRAPSGWTAGSQPTSACNHQTSRELSAAAS